PKIALLSNGAEANKGAPEVVQAHRILRGIPSLNFIGNVEGLDIPKGTADVIVCEGFLGNVALKMLEGVGEVASTLIRDASEKNLIWRMGIGMLYQGIQHLKALTDWKQYGGAPILGLNRVVIKAHGRSNARAIRNAIKLAHKAMEKKMIHRINSGLQLATEVWKKNESR
ncbi:MAG: phosphate acyltransferase PlsX, partial [Myxococcota bacterium]|nr:phosphate acyltransferase PlsX [Myxococcota bacterium]